MLSTEGAHCIERKREAKRVIENRTPNWLKTKASQYGDKIDPKDPKHTNPSLSLNNDTNQKNIQKTNNNHEKTRKSKE